MIEIVDRKFMVREKLADMGMEELQAITGAKLNTDVPVANLVVPAL